jgi:exopolysaccharide biosynthesis polyprenyl glycosylphosphotransferase
MDGTTIAPPTSAPPAPRPPARGRMRRRVVRELLVTDLGALLVGAAATVLAGSRASLPDASPLWVAAFCVAVVVVLAAGGGYRFRLEMSPLDQLGRVIHATTLVAAGMLVARVALDNDALLAERIVRTWAFITAFLVFGRVGAAIYRLRPGRPRINTLVLGAGDVGQRVARHLREHPEWGLEPVGFLDKDPRIPPGDRIVPVLGASWDLERVVAEQRVNHVVVAFSRAPNDVLLSLVRRCRALDVAVSVVPRLFEEVSNRVYVEHLGGLPILRVDRADPRGWQFDVKYAADRILAAVAIALLSPLLAALAVAVRLSSPGPLLFRQTRIGLDGRAFDILKFRTMEVVSGAPENDAAWAAAMLGDGDDAPVSPAPDRTTRVGRLLRRWSLDELPQLFNVVRGEMSFVGPRPERVGMVEAFEQRVYRYGDRHRVKSGLTGWAQVNGLRGETSLEDRIAWDNYYVENWTPWLDVKTLLLTLPAVMEGPRTR